ncbi:hypothetical protein AXF42_Ash011451 [Apostasia shenzhenica]|uniref:TOM1-like protein 2 n=1 Tax=Apostasia shenzhenica TaxID=1088818 RepID=A0A2I0BAR1_9ASPA|nr:hypothetical protein AXF42_Ash011451 [Apostasia shenzhenica]
MVPALQWMFPTASSAAARVEKATSRLLLGPDWTMNMDICDSINSDPWQTKDYVKAVKKRMRNKNSKVQFLALTLLETMVKNCGELVHYQITERQILQEMIKIVRQTKNMQVREKILVLLDSWQQAFGGSEGKHPQYYFAYAELKISLSDLQNIQRVMELFSNMLQAVNPEDHGAIKDEVLIDLANQCRACQRRLMELINLTESEKLLEETLALNDSLQVILAKYDAIASGLPLPPEKSQPQPRPSAPPPSAPALISQFEEKEEEEEEDDGFSAEPKLISNVDLDFSQSSSELTSSTSTTAASTASSSSTSNALVLFNPKDSVNPPKKEEDMIGLLSLALVTDQPRQTTPPPQPASNPNQDPFFSSPSWQEYTSYPQLSNYIPYNNYIAPWAQPAIRQPVPPAPDLPQKVPEYQYSYLPPSYISTGASFNPFLPMTSIQNPASQSEIAAGRAVTTATTGGSKALQKFDTFDSKQAQMNTNSEKHFMPDKLFDDLIALRNPDESLKSRNASTLWVSSGQGLTIGRR